MARGRLRIYLGAAPGVGKTFAMLGEGKRRAARGTDVIVGVVETHGRQQTSAQLAGLTVLPPRVVEYRGAAFTELDLDAALERAPEVVLVDELAHSNVPGSRHAKRWQDVEELLAAGIDVVSTLNVQHLESLNDVVEQITGVRQRETVPDEVVRAADQIELIDMTPEAIRRRMAHGNIYAPTKVDAALANYFRPGNLGALRELALLWVADRVDESLLQYRADHDIDRRWETRERVVVALTGAPSGEQLIRRAARIAERSRGGLIGVHVTESDGRTMPSHDTLAAHRQLLEDLGGEFREVVADDVVVALVGFARRENATQLVLGASGRTRWTEAVRGSVINRVVRQSGDIDVHIISTFADGAAASGATAMPKSARPERVAPLPRRRRQAGWLIALLGPLVLTAGLTQLRDTLDQGSQMLLFQVLVLLAAMTGGSAPAVVAAVWSSLVLNWFFTEPHYTLTIADGENALALVVFVIVGFLVGLLVNQLARRSEDAKRGRVEAEALTRIAAGMVGAGEPLPVILDQVRTTLGVAGISVHADASGPALATAGETPDPTTDRSIVVGDKVVRLRGTLSPDDERMLSGFTAQLAATFEQQSLREEAARVDVLDAADKLRTAILRAVSHDLRTPLASIKASVTSLLARDVAWPPEAQTEFLGTIDEEADRLDVVIGNLLDASRLEAGAIHAEVQLVALDDVVPVALATISDLTAPVDVDISTDLSLVHADGGLLERVIANLVSNAVHASPPGSPVRIAASQQGGVVELRIVDRGPGVPAEKRERMFQPFQRLGDTATGNGVGLGLAVASGFVDAMDGTLTVEDTPGGGLTMVVGLQAADS